MDNKESQNCWEFWNCPEETKIKCPAFIYPDEKCWIVASSVNGCFKTKEEGFRFCVQTCDWFKKVNPDFFKDVKR